MLLNRENKENRQVVLTIQVEQSAWEKALEDAYEQSKSLFKKEDGSLPTRQEMEEKHGADVFYQDAVNSTFPVALVEAVRQEDISVAGAPELSVEAIGPEGYVFTALIDLYPEVKLGQYKGSPPPGLRWSCPMTTSPPPLTSICRATLPRSTRKRPPWATRWCWTLRAL